MWMFSRKKLDMPSPEEALPGHSEAMKVPATSPAQARPSDGRAASW